MVVVVGVGAVGAANISCNGTVVEDSRHGSVECETVGHVAAEIAHDAAVIIDASQVISRGEGGGANATADGASVTVAHHAAVILGRVGYGMDGDVAAHAAVLHDAALTVVR